MSILASCAVSCAYATCGDTSAWPVIIDATSKSGSLPSRKQLITVALLSLQRIAVRQNRLEGQPLQLGLIRRSLNFCRLE